MLTVQCDFDDTITVTNVGTALLENFSQDQRRWRQIEEEYQSGHISVEECNRRQYVQLKVSKEAIQDFVAETVEVRPGFLQVVEHCRKEGIRFVIVSGGLDLYIEPILRKVGLLDMERYSGQARVTPEGFAIDYIDPDGINRQEGFKLACLRYLRQDGRPIVCIGDGFSDIAPAMEADYVIARDGLEMHFRSNSLAHFTFDTFHDVQEHLQELQHLHHRDER